MIIITIILIRWRLVHLPGQQVGAFQVEGAADNARGDHGCRDGVDLYDDDHDCHDGDNNDGDLYGDCHDGDGDLYHDDYDCHDARVDHDLNDDDLDYNDDK